MMATLQQWREFKANDNPALREQLITEYAPFVRYVVGRMAVSAPRAGALSEEDLIGEAIVGLLEAVERFDPEQGVKFESFAYHRIRGAILDLLRRMDLLSQSAREGQNRLEEAYQRLLSELGRQPREEEVAEALGLSLEQLEQLFRDCYLQTVVSLDLPVSEEEGPATLLETVQDQGDGPEQVVIASDDQRRLAAAIRDLPESERQVLSLYYHDRLTMKEIGLVLGVTESRVCQIHAKAITRLRATLRAEETIPCR